MDTPRNIKIVSGGQTGVDIAGLDVARSLNLPWGGWAPKGWIQECGLIPDEYRWNGKNGLKENDQGPWSKIGAYVHRTKRNVLESDFTIIIFRGEITTGTKLTEKFCKELRKPHWLFNLDRSCLVAEEDLHCRLLLEYVKNPECIINIAGPRESKRPGIYLAAKSLLTDVLRK
jgi:hypothetical protein